MIFTSGPFAERGRIRTWMCGIHADFDKLADVLRERADVTPVPDPPTPPAPSPQAPPRQRHERPAQKAAVAPTPRATESKLAVVPS